MFYVMPVTTPVIVEHPDFEVPPSALVVDPEDTCTLLMGDYNVRFSLLVTVNIFLR